MVACHVRNAVSTDICHVDCQTWCCCKILVIDVKVACICVLLNTSLRQNVQHASSVLHCHCSEIWHLLFSFITQQSKCSTYCLSGIRIEHTIFTYFQHHMSDQHLIHGFFARLLVWIFLLLKDLILTNYSKRVSIHFFL